MHSLNNDILHGFFSLKGAILWATDDVGKMSLDITQGEVCIVNCS